MKRYRKQLLSYVVAPAALILLTSALFADGLAPQAGPTLISSCGFGWVDVSGNSSASLPGGEGIVLVDLLQLGGNSSGAETPSGKLNFHCDGRLPLGGQVQAVDFATGELVEATLATRDEACEAIRDVFPDACRGHNGPWISTFQTVGIECFVTNPEPPFQQWFTQDWIGVVARNGQASLNCHFDDFFRDGERAQGYE